MNEERKTKLQSRMLTSIVLFALVIVIATSTMVALQYYFAHLRTYKNRAFCYTHTLVDMIDGDRIAEYIETGKKDDYYYDILSYVNSAKTEFGLKYYYVYVPHEEDFVYVWDADCEEEAAELGEHEVYSNEKNKKTTFEVFRKDPPEEVSMERDNTYGYTASAYSPIFDSNGQPVAIAAVDIAVSSIKMEVLQYMLLIILVIALITVVTMIVYYISLKKGLIIPIRQLRKTTSEMLENIENDREPVKLEINTGDEIEDLADAVNLMGHNLWDYIRKLSKVTAEKERIGAELNIAKRIQGAMLPRIFPPYPDRKEFDLYASMEPAKEVGGDFYDFFMIDDDHIALVMADVSGKGVPAALFMVISKVMIKNAVMSGLSPGPALDQVNKRLLEGNDTGMFVTVWLAIIDLKTGVGVSANAGHEHPALKNADGEFELIKYKHSPAVSTIDGVSYREREFKLEAGDSLFVYTDGVTEATSSDIQLFGEERLVKTLNENRDIQPDRVIGVVKGAIEDFVGDAPQFDDITMLYFRYNGSDN